MSTMNEATAASSRAPEADRLLRILSEGYGPGAWHGPDMKAALSGLAPEEAFWRPAPERHNIAEIALHHAYYLHSVRGKLAAAPIEPFALTGEDWFELPGKTGMTWPSILETVASQHQKLEALIRDSAAGRASSPLPDSECLGLILGITCHAAYHAGQIQLLRRLRSQ